MNGILGNRQIKKYLKKGEIIIHPFIESNLNTASYDVTLGEHYYKEQMNDKIFYNIYSESDINKIWGQPQEAKKYKDIKNEIGYLENVSDEDKIIILKPGENILVNTNEYIGGVSKVTTMMKARSSLGRSFIITCNCAGLGDVGYFNRWTMEITNKSNHYSIPLVVGRRVAQIVFFETGYVDNNYNLEGKYQKTTKLDEMIINWHPSQMLPKLFKDKEIKNNKNGKN